MSASVEIPRAQARARRLYTSKGFRGAYVKGVRAALAGHSIDSCPYPRTPAQTWRRAWRLAWTRGFQSVRPHEDER